MGHDIRLNIGDEYSQEDPSVAALANGTFVAVWSDSESDPGADGFTGIAGGIFSATGVPLGNQFRVNVDPRGQQFTPLVTASGSGFVVAWGSEGPDAAGDDDPYIDLFVRRFDAAGRPLAGPVQIAGREDINHQPQDIATLADGSVVVVSASSFLRTDWDLIVHRFTPGGARLGPPRVLHQDIDTGTPAAFRISTPGAHVTPLIGGDYHLTFYENVDVPGSQGATFDRSILAQRFHANGTVAGALQHVTPPINGDITLDREYASAALLAGGGTVAVAWTADPFDIHQTLYDAVEFRIIAADGRPLTPIVRVDGGNAEGDQQAQDVIHLGQGYSLVTYTSYAPDVGAFYEDYYSLNGRIFSPTGAPLGQPFFISEFAYEDTSSGSATRLANGQLLFSWDGGASVEEDVFARILGGQNDPGVRLGGPAAEVIVGKVVGDLILAGAGNDTVNGGAGNDALFGEAGDDTLIGWTGSDRLVGGDGGDFLRGGAIGDRLEGGPGVDRLFGEAGNDILTGGPGIDVLVGGPGGDRFVFADGDLGPGPGFGPIERIVDLGLGDRIDLSAIDAAEQTARNDPFRWIGQAQFSGTAGELRDFGRGYLVGDTDGDGRGDVMLLAPGFDRFDLIF